MNTDTHLALSYYETIKELSEEHNIALVQNRQTNEICVRKDLQIYHARVFRQLREHPVNHTPRIYELYESGGILTVIEEFIPGSTLERLIDQYGPLPPEKAYAYMCALCDILTDLHSMAPPVIHRDIKPSNIMIRPDGQLVLLDFNAARQYEASKWNDTQLLGTKGYAAPEQYGFGESSERTDIYAAGILLKTMLTGTEKPWTSVSGNAGEIIGICTKLDPAERYPSAAALKSALQSWMPKQAAQLPPDKNDWKRFLPPGFRALHPGHMLGMFLLYYVIIWMCLTITFDGRPPGFLWFDRACLGAGLLFIVFFSGNYLNIQERLLPKHPLLRLILVILIDIAAFAFSSIFATAVEMIFFAMQG